MLIDLVYGGETFYNLVDLLHAWATSTRARFAARRRKIPLSPLTGEKDIPTGTASAVA